MHNVISTWHSARNQDRSVIDTVNDILFSLWDSQQAKGIARCEFGDPPMIDDFFFCRTGSLLALGFQHYTYMVFSVKLGTSPQKRLKGSY